MSPVTAEERRAWIDLAAVDGVGERTLGRLILAFGSARAVLEVARGRDEDAAIHRVELACGVRAEPGVASRIRMTTRDPGAIERRVADLGGWTLTPFDAAYPARLGILDPPPAVLFGAGDPTALDAPRSIAVVGTRHPTVAGRLLAGRVATRLVECGATVISGLAVGVDGAAHAATLDAGGRTVAVIGGGLAQPGPAVHRRLLRALLAAGGAVCGEHPPDAVPTRGTFPRRNRIISALSSATIVIEAPARSGALITARHALEQGRQLIVAPGRPGDPAVAGCLALLRETPARPLVGLDELVVDLGLDTDALTSPADRESDADHLTLDRALLLLGTVERRVAEQVAAAPASTDSLIAVTGLPPAVVSGALTLLQLRGWVRPMGPLQLPAGPLLRTRAKAT